MLKILWKRGEIAPEEQFLLLFTIISYLILDFYVKTRIGFSLRDKRLFEITEVEITRVDCITFSFIVHALRADLVPRSPGYGFVPSSFLGSILMRFRTTTFMTIADF